MKDSTVKLLGATQKVRDLIALGGDTQPVAVAFGNALGWKWPQGMDPLETGWVARLCDLLNVNLPGRPSLI